MINWITAGFDLVTGWLNKVTGLSLHNYLAIAAEIFYVDNRYAVSCSQNQGQFKFDHFTCTYDTWQKCYSSMDLKTKSRYFYD